MNILTTKASKCRYNTFFAKGFLNGFARFFLQGIWSTTISPLRIKSWMNWYFLSSSCLSCVFYVPCIMKQLHCCHKIWQVVCPYQAPYLVSQGTCRAKSLLWTLLSNSATYAASMVELAIQHFLTILQEKALQIKVKVYLVVDFLSSLLAWKLKSI